jgi:class 3 adenylate cyclase/tetratricopeptide (TPR) repeat protein
VRTSSALPADSSTAGAEAYLAAVHGRWLASDPGRAWQELDATLLFADVSGFTVLGERLARRGRIGAEQLTDAVNAVFGHILRDTQELGGDILKFGGDAVLVLFEGRRHAERGCRAAVAMQEAMRAVRRGRISGAPISLALSAGVATGRAHLFLAGRDHRELIVSGPLTTAVLEQEAAADAGTIGAAGELELELERQWLRVRAHTGGGLLRPPGPPRRPAGVDARLGLPAHLHDRLSGEGEHRPVTIGFIQYRGVDGLLASEGPGAVATALDELIVSVQDACAMYGVTFVGTDVDRDGGKVILATGAPTASPDDADRMLNATLDVTSERYRLSVRAGVNGGRAFVFDVGMPERRAWTLMGDTVNLAARVMGHAPADGVLAHENVLARAREPFDRTPVPPFAVKGKSAVVRAEVVRPGRGVAAPAVTGRVLGRETELGLLRGELARVRAGGSAAVQLVGEPGIGKTTLLQALLEEVGDLDVVRVQAGPYAAFSPFRALILPLRSVLLGDVDDGTALPERLRRRVAELAPDLLPWLPLIAIPLALRVPSTPQTRELSAEFGAARMHDAVSRLLSAALPGRSVLAVEDAHWLDEASTELLSSAIRRLGRDGRLVVITSRDVAAGLRLGTEAGARRIDLKPLDPASARALLREGPDSGLAPQVEAELVERGGGNPLFLLELLAAARAGGDVNGLPETVEALIAARIDTLPVRERGLLRQAAVLGMGVPEDLLDALLEREPGGTAPDLARLEDFLHRAEDGQLRFRHALLREVAYEGLAFRRRRVLHGRAAELIAAQAGDAADERAEILAIHYHAAYRWRESWRFSRIAAEQAIEHAAPADAAGFLSRAIEAARHAGATPEEVATVAEQLGDVAQFAGRYDDAAAAYRATRRRRRGDPIAEAELCRKEGWVRDRRERYAQALRWYTRGLRLLEAMPDDDRVAGLRARLVLARGAARLRQGRLRTSLPLLEEAAETARAAGDRATLAHAFYLLDWAHTDLGSPEAERFRAQALPIFEELGDHHGRARVLNNLGVDAYQEGRWGEAVERYEDSLAANERVGDVIQVAIIQNNIAEIRCDQGRLDDAEALLTEALGTWRAAGYAVGVGVALGNLGRVATLRGSTDAAKGLLARARERFAAIGAEALALETDAHEAERLLVAGDHAAALALLGRVREDAKRLGGAPGLLAMLQRLAGCAKAQAGDREGARVRMHECLELARPVHAAYEEALALDALWVLGGPDAREARTLADAIFDQLEVVSPARMPLVSIGHLTG